MFGFGSSFRHGVHPPDHKELTGHLPVKRMPFPAMLALPLRQHAGKPARCIVQPGDRVERGDLIGEADGFVSVPIHASSAGTVRSIELWPHPDGSMAETVILDVEQFSAQVPRPRIVPEWEGLEPKEIVGAVQAGGVVGLGGAAFPTHVKLSPPPEVSLDVLLVNGAECEPYLTSDHRLMVERPDRVHMGARILMRTLGVDRCVIGVEKNKPDAISALQATIPDDLDLTVLPLTVKYPQGAEKMLIKAVTGREVPSGKLPMHVGAVVQNVGSLAAVAEIFETGLPLIERLVTVSGPAIREPANLIMPVGTRLRDAIEFCGGLAEDVHEIVLGGPMMGASQPDLDAPVIKGTSGIVCLSEAQARPPRVYPCIRCGRCLDSCPVFLNPSTLGLLAQAGRYDDMREMHLNDCMLCGCCSYVCPSNIPLSQMFALSKRQLRKLQTVPAQTAPAQTAPAQTAPAQPVSVRVHSC